MHSYYDTCLTSIVNRYCKLNLKENLILCFPCTDIYKDVQTGEILTADNQTEKIKLRVNQKKNKDVNTENTQGSDRDRIYVEGYLIDPLRVDFDLGDRIDGYYLYEGNWVNCSFYSVNRLASSFTETNNLHNATGRRIEGYLKLQRSN